MKHFQDEDYDSMRDYEFNIMSHMSEEDKEDDYDGSLVFRHWYEDNDSMEDYEFSVFNHND